MGTSSIILRISNPIATGVNDHNRIENEVAAIIIAREALKPKAIVPAIYGWHSSSGDYGWTLQEFMRGKVLDAPYEAMSLKDKQNIVMQMAEITYALQSFQLPSTVTGYGGLDIDAKGNIINGQMTILTPGGPYPTYRNFYRDMLQYNLADADKSPVLEGWRPNGVRQRIDRFLADGFDKVFDKVEDTEKTLVHCDLTTNNLLYDDDTMQITGVIDFDFAFIGGPADDFFRSFHNIQGQIVGPYSKNPVKTSLRKAYLDGFPDLLPEDASKTPWITAKIWEEVLASKGAQRPSTINGFAELSSLHWFGVDLCPFVLSEPTCIARRTEEQLKSQRDDAEVLVVKYLEGFGY
ncbi:hypothetical protein MMC25_005616 [Agyrium rufum]|nr:hypothetical protein [Agyrium rufum]